MLYVCDNAGKCDDEMSGIHNVHADSLRMFEWLQQDGLCSRQDISDGRRDVERRNKMLQVYGLSDR